VNANVKILLLSLNIFRAFPQVVLYVRPHAVVHKQGKGKGKAIPLQTLSSPEGSRRLRLPDFNTIST
jgi:hypothetical protein